MTVKDETLAHIAKVAEFIKKVTDELYSRGVFHDTSKLISPEVEVFEEYTCKLKGSTYGSPEYKQMLADMKPALIHHYNFNRHHPEHHANGIKDMSLIDILEMLCDWKAATLRHADGDIEKSLEINQSRFGYSDELKSILRNTLKHL